MTITQEDKNRFLRWMNTLVIATDELLEYAYEHNLAKFSKELNRLNARYENYNAHAIRIGLNLSQYQSQALIIERNLNKIKNILRHRERNQSYENITSPSLRVAGKIDSFLGIFGVRPIAKTIVQTISNIFGLGNKPRLPPPPQILPLPSNIPQRTSNSKRIYTSSKKTTANKKTPIRFFQRKTSKSKLNFFPKKTSTNWPNIKKIDIYYYTKNPSSSLQILFTATKLSVSENYNIKVAINIVDSKGLIAYRYSGIDKEHSRDYKFGFRISNIIIPSSTLKSYGIVKKTNIRNNPLNMYTVKITATLNSSRLKSLDYKTSTKLIFFALLK